MKYEILELLHNGYNVDIYLINYNNKINILKKYKILSRKKNYKYTFWREIDVCKFIDTLSNKNQNFFMKLHNYSINTCKQNCTIEYYDENKNKNIKKKTNLCLDLILEYKGQSLNKLISLTTNISLKEKYNLIIQIIYMINIFRKNGYVHNDIHNKNITYDKSDGNVKIGNITLKSKYKYSLIDYNNSLHNKYSTDSRINTLLKINYDLLYFIKHIILQKNLIYNLNINFTIFFKMEELQIIFSKHRRLWNKIKNTLISNGKDYIKWFNTFESGLIHTFYNNFENDYPTLKNNKYIELEIEILLSAYNRKLWLLLYNPGVKYIPNLIPGKDIEYLILYKNSTSKLIQYFVNKYN